MSNQPDTITCPCTGDTLRRTQGPRADWKMPEAPVCETCSFDDDTGEYISDVVMKPGCHLEDAWMLFWWCPECDYQGDGDEIDWPYAQDEYANADDLRALGFEVV